VLSWLSRQHGWTFDEIEERHSLEQVSLLYYLGRKDEFTLAENEAKMHAKYLADILAPAFGLEPAP